MTINELEDFLDLWDLSDEEFSRCIGVTPAAVKHWLRGIREIPGYVERFYRFCKRFEIDPRKFIVED